jgi:hypothetical protein
MAQVPPVSSPLCSNQLNVSILIYSEFTHLVLQPSLYGAGTHPATDIPGLSFWVKIHWNCEGLLPAIDNPNLNHVQTEFNGTPYLIGFSFCPSSENKLGVDILLAVPAEEIVGPVTQSRYSSILPTNLQNFFVRL